MLARAARPAARRAALGPLRRVAGSQRAMAAGFTPPKYHTDFAPDLVVEGIPDDPLSQPKVYEKEIWDNPDMLLPERMELWYDDGSAEPEFYYDHEWPVTNGEAVRDLAIAFALVLGGIGTFATMFGERMRPVDPYQNSWPFDLKREHGLPEGDDDDEEEEDDE
mmetsp:Transcript_18785/g.54253  ORF Transcript_18785/g.54253 Transcript_18785/m.54253 type:complete len:164 (-) Transcript_18785:2-493(-)